MKKLKYYGLSFLILFMFCFSPAQSVSESTAKIVAQNFINSKSDAAQKKPVDLVNITPDIDAKYDGFYIFKNSLGNGFYIISSEYGNHPVLGYSNDTTISPYGEISPGFLYILDWYQSVNEGLRKSSLKSKGTGDEEELSSKIKKEWEVLLSSGGNNNPLGAKSTESEVSPLIETTWAQGTPYNQNTPRTDEEQPTVTGCIATAMSQIMKFWNHPTTGTGSKTYTIPNTYYDWHGKELTVDFESITYDWDNMPNSLTSSSTTVEKDAVATLMYHTGVSVDMEYGVDASAAYDANAYTAFRNYFKYHNATYVSRGSKTDAEWLNLIKDQITKGFPVFFAGTDTAQDVGHAFIADGYDPDDLIHFNFGWGGYQDGYFTITEPNPLDYNFSADQAAIVNIYPDNTRCGTPVNLSVSNVTDKKARLSWTAISEASSYTVEYKAAGASDWIPVTTTSLYYNLSGLTNNTTYNWRVKTNCSSSDSSEYTAESEFTTSLYCISLDINALGERISNVEFGSINNASTGTNGYEDFTSESTNLTKGASYDISIAHEAYAMNYQEAYVVFIDYNHDGDFDDEGETVWTREHTAISTVSGTITIPATALSGVTRMRVSMKHYATDGSSGNEIPGPCETFGGQVEDYTVNIEDNLGTDDVQAKSTSSTLYPNPVRDILYIRGIDTGNAEYTKVTIIDRNGRTVKTTQARVGDVIEVNVSDLSPSIYYLNILGESYKFIKINK
ncbi:MAG: C10 family peptidase [Flavobacteriaceae bacterium]|jgi:hypothetical protein|nr:C10 family peptidase [Flavobacteriaceae bacterium]